MEYFCNRFNNKLTSDKQQTSSRPVLLLHRMSFYFNCLKMCWLNRFWTAVYTKWLIVTTSRIPQNAYL